MAIVHFPFYAFSIYAAFFRIANAVCNESRLYVCLYVLTFTRLFPMMMMKLCDLA